MKIIKWILFGLFFSQAVLADQASKTLQNILNRTKLSAPGAATLNNVEDIFSITTLLNMVVIQYRDSPAGIEAKRILDAQKEEIRRLKAEIKPQLDADEAERQAAVAKVEAAADIFRKDIRDKRSAEHNFKKDECVARDSGPGNSTYQLTVIKIVGVDPPNLLAKLVYRAQPADLFSNSWERILSDARAWDVPESAIKDGAVIPCNKAEKVVALFRDARKVAKRHTPLKKKLETMEMVLAIPN